MRECRVNVECFNDPEVVIPAQAGIHLINVDCLDTRLRGNDGRSPANPPQALVHWVIHSTFVHLSFVHCRPAAAYSTATFRITAGSVEDFSPGISGSTASTIFSSLIAALLNVAVKMHGLSGVSGQ